MSGWSAYWHACHTPRVSTWLDDPQAIERHEKLREELRRYIKESALRFHWLEGRWLYSSGERK